MTESDWGLCKDCKWWQIELQANIANTTMGLCIEESLQPFRLRVSGSSGCNRPHGRATGACSGIRSCSSDCCTPTLESENFARQLVKE